jgi:GTP-binding protein
MENIYKAEISAVNKKGFKKVFTLTDRVIKKSKESFATSKLNKLLDKFVKNSSPPSFNGRQLKFKHIHFGGTYPTTLIIHSNQDKKIPSNYKKYLENSFRKELNLKSIQLKLIFRKSSNPYEGKKNKLTDRQTKKRQRLIKHKNKSKK